MTIGPVVKIGGITLTIICLAVSVGVWANEMDTAKKDIKNLEKSYEERTAKIEEEVSRIDIKTQKIDISVARIEQKLEYMDEGRKELQQFVKEGFADMKQLIRGG